MDINSGSIETDYGPYITTLIKGKGVLTSGKLTPSVDYVQNPTFEVNVLSQQDFMKGFYVAVRKRLTGILLGAGLAAGIPSVSLRA
ncbi:MAG TPA: hypothetical protein VH988_31820 [Thermoanaerobaculia bacterium]|nr:hypothetical protein [Thermoanaerobaculia bacterium]